jgi:hypothetical protein
MGKDYSNGRGAFPHLDRQGSSAITSSPHAKSEGLKLYGIEKPVK